jgi:hypothetical protein
MAQQQTKSFEQGLHSPRKTHAQDHSTNHHVETHLKTRRSDTRRHSKHEGPDGHLDQH